MKESLTLHLFKKNIEGCDESKWQENIAHKPQMFFCCFSLHVNKVRKKVKSLGSDCNRFKWISKYMPILLLIKVIIEACISLSEKARKFAFALLYFIIVLPSCWSNCILKNKFACVIYVRTIKLLTRLFLL